MWSDALFKAFHHQALKHILPFPAKYDKESWWISRLQVIYSVELIFRGQTLYYLPTAVYNRQHRAYPQGHEMFSARVPVIIEDNQNKAPTAYQNGTLFSPAKR